MDAGPEGADVTDAAADNDGVDDEVNDVGASRANLVRMASLIGEDSRWLGGEDISDVADVTGGVEVAAEVEADVDAGVVFDDDALSSPFGSDSVLKIKNLII